MKLIIDLDEKYYNDIKNSPTASNYSTLYALFGIRNGTLLSEELEKIKAEIEEMKGDELPYNASDYLYGRYQAFDIVVDILQDRIAELKGENK